jgi:hypothetical protein
MRLTWKGKCIKRDGNAFKVLQQYEKGKRLKLIVKKFNEMSGIIDMAQDIKQYTLL